MHIGVYKRIKMKIGKYKRTKKIRKKQSKSQNKRFKKQSERDKIGKALKGFKHSEQSCKNMSNAHIGNKHSKKLE